MKATSLKVDKINTSISELLTTVTENHNYSKKTIHHKLKEYQNPILFYLDTIGLMVELFTTFSLILAGLDILKNAEFYHGGFIRIFFSCFDKVE